MARATFLAILSRVLLLLSPPLHVSGHQALDTLSLTLWRKIQFEIQGDSWLWTSHALLPRVCFKLQKWWFCLSLVLICRRCACDMAAVSAWDTVPIWEQKWRATLIIPVFTAGMTAKLTRVQLSRHAGGKALWWLKLLAVHVLIRPRCSPGSTGGYVTGTLVVYENQALTNEPLLSSQSSFRGHLPVPWGWLLNGGWIQLM